MSVWYVICIILPCNQEYTLCGRATGVSMPHDPPSSYERIRAAPRGSSPFPFVSVRCGANPLHVSSWHCLAIASLVYSFPPPVAACPFRLTSRRGPSHISYPSRFSALQHAAFPFHLAALPVLPVVPYLRIWVARSVLFGDLLLDSLPTHTQNLPLSVLPCLNYSNLPCYQYSKRHYYTPSPQTRPRREHGHRGLPLSLPSPIRHPCEPAAISVAPPSP